MDLDDLSALRYKRLKRAFWWNTERTARRTRNWSILLALVGTSLIIAPSLWLVILWAAILSRWCYVITQLLFSIRARKRYGLSRLHSRTA